MCVSFWTEISNKNLHLLHIILPFPPNKLLRLQTHLVTMDQMWVQAGIFPCFKIHTLDLEIRWNMMQWWKEGCVSRRRCTVNSCKLALKTTQFWYHSILFLMIKIWEVLYTITKIAWPSGLRRWFKAPVSSEAWVRIPPLSGIHSFLATVQYYQILPFPKSKSLHIIHSNERPQ